MPRAYPGRYAEVVVEGSTSSWPWQRWRDVAGIQAPQIPHQHALDPPFDPAHPLARLPTIRPTFLSPFFLHASSSSPYPHRTTAAISPSLPPHFMARGAAWGAAAGAAAAGVTSEAALVLVSLALLLSLWNRQLRRSTSGSCQQYSLDEVSRATDYFAEENKIGTGGFAHVYRGTSPFNPDSLWAVKRCTVPTEHFGRVVREMSNKIHPNLVRLIGCCNDFNEGEGRHEQIVICELMPGGSIHGRFSRDSRDPLTLQQRLDILIGVARGLEFLHSFGIVHRDIKPANILLDSNMQAKISAFGAVRMGYDEHMVQSMGTHGYIDPASRANRNARPSADVYSFGVVMLEMLTGRKAVEWDGNADSNFKGWVVQCLYDRNVALIGDPHLKAPDSVVVRMADLALPCLAMPPDSRPSMARVIHDLEAVKLFIASQWPDLVHCSPDAARAGDGASGELSSGEAVSGPTTTTTIARTNSNVAAAERRGPLLCQQVSVAEVVRATGGWAAERRIGSGGFGDVYRGVSPLDGCTPWAVKRAKVLTNDFRREINEMASKHHPNLVRLLGFCIDGDTASENMEQIAIYEFMPNGDLEKRLHPGTSPEPLSLRQRLDILIGVARGLEYLHSFGIVHRDIKPANILLDHNMKVKHTFLATSHSPLAPPPPFTKPQTSILSPHTRVRKAISHSRLVPSLWTHSLAPSLSRVAHALSVPQAKLSDFGLVRMVEGTTCQSTRVHLPPSPPPPLLYPVISVSLYMCLCCPVFLLSSFFFLSHICPTSSPTNPSPSVSPHVILLMLPWHVVVISFGIVMLELLTGHRVVFILDGGAPMNIKEWVEQRIASGEISAIGDPFMRAPDSLVLRTARLALRCTAALTAARPTMGEAATELETLKKEFFGLESGRMAQRVDEQMQSLRLTHRDLREELQMIAGIESSASSATGRRLSGGVRREEAETVSTRAVDSSAQLAHHRCAPLRAFVGRERGSAGHGAGRSVAGGRSAVWGRPSGKCGGRVGELVRCQARGGDAVSSGGGGRGGGGAGGTGSGGYRSLEELANSVEACFFEVCVSNSGRPAAMALHDLVAAAADAFLAGHSLQRLLLQLQYGGAEGEEFRMSEAGYRLTSSEQHYRTQWIKTVYLTMYRLHLQQPGSSFIHMPASQQSHGTPSSSSSSSSSSSGGSSGMDVSRAAPGLGMFEGAMPPASEQPMFDASGSSNRSGGDSSSEETSSSSSSNSVSMGALEGLWEVVEEEPWLGSIVDRVLEGQRTGEEQSLVHFDRALATAGASGGVAAERRVIAPQWLPISQLVLLTCKVVNERRGPL
ncbi:unnamed protein product [Closterium sp. NIES-54]